MLISIKPDNKLGHLTLCPIEVEDCHYVAQSNKYNNEFRAYMQFEDEINLVHSLLSEDNVSDLNFGITIRKDIDEHTYRHMVGGQSD